MILRFFQRMGRLTPFALLLSCLLLFIFSPPTQARSILQKADPTPGSTLVTRPERIQLWFNEAINPQLSEAQVLDQTQKRVDVNGAIVIPTNQNQLVLSLQPADGDPAGIYTVQWVVQSPRDGQILRGSYTFTVTSPNGSIPANIQNTGTGIQIVGLDLSGLLSMLMIILIEAGTLFWVGAQLWHTFVSQGAEQTKTSTQQIEAESDDRFLRLFSLPTLRILFLANIGLLLGQNLELTNGRFDQLFSIGIWVSLLSNGRFALFWVIRLVIILLAMSLGTIAYFRQRRSERMTQSLPWLNLLLGLALLVAMTLSTPAPLLDGVPGVLSVLMTWLHFLSFAIWIGGLFYLILVYLPILKSHQAEDQAQSMRITLSNFVPIICGGMFLAIVSTIFFSVTSINTWTQLYTTSIGLFLILRALLVVTLLILTSITFLVALPRLRRDQGKYQRLIKETSNDEDEEKLIPAETEKRLSLLRKRVQNEQQGLEKMLRWLPLFATLLLVCAGFLYSFADTILPATAQQSGENTNAPQVFRASTPTSDKIFNTQLTITPIRAGINAFTVVILDSEGRIQTDIQVSLAVDMPEMNMEDLAIALKADNQGSNSGTGTLGMAGNWIVKIQIHTPDQQIHEADVQLFVPPSSNGQ